MDITARSFERLLPRVLSDIADSEYVALDMEFSGIARQDAIPSGKKKRTLQDRYHEVKDAAKTFAVLQIGLTFVKRDPEAGSFTLRPYNLHLNPLLDQKLEIERRWTYQSSAIDFLLRHGFQMEAPYKDGLRYLSRREEALALAVLEEKEKRREALEDIKEESMTPEDIAFVREVRRMMNAWIDSKKVRLFTFYPTEDSLPLLAPF
ncbi:hypothetical protein KEM55_006796 [Ascosphaera atra]|nr:hypothetical protein KEM55_006796 [Ascosphaera atra]